MKANCAPVCFSCEYLTFQGRCPLSDSISEQNVWRHAGDLHRMFERIVSVATNNSSRYADDDDAVRIQSQRGTNKTLAIAAISSVPLLTPPYPFQVLSQPTRQTNMNEAVVENTGIVGESATAQYDESDSDPWVVVVDDFLTEQECAALIELGSELGYERSTGLNRALKADGTHGSSVVEGRTSSNTWCKDDCFTNSTTKRVLAKIEQLTGIPDDNSEFLQLLHYDVGQFYQTHHDFIDFHLDRGQGVRIVTVFLYLNDVEEGMN